MGGSFAITCIDQFHIPGWVLKYLMLGMLGRFVGNHNLAYVVSLSIIFHS
jgi:hypothetical protein